MEENNTLNKQQGNKIETNKENITKSKTPVEMLMQYQVPHVYQLFESIQNTQCIVDGSDTGTGKTYITLALCFLLKLKPFIICPKSVISAWTEVAQSMGVEILGAANYEKIKGGKYYTPNLEIVECPYLDKVYAGEEIVKTKTKIKDKNKDNGEINSEINSKQNDKLKINKITKKVKKDYIFQFPTDTLIVIDEAHRCKNYKSENSHMLLALKDSNRKIILLSATLADKIECFKPFGVMLGLYNNVNKFKLWIRSKLNPKDEMLLKLKKMREKEKKKRDKILSKFLNKKDDSLGEPTEGPIKGPIKEPQKVSSDEVILDIIHKSIYPNKGSRMKIKELGDMFPQNQVVARCYYSEDHCEVDEIYDLINKALQDIKKKEQGSCGLGEIMRCRMRLEMLKLPIILDLVDEGLEANRSVVIFVNFKDSMTYLQHHLKEECSLIHGEQSLDERKLNIDQFQTNKTKIMIAISQAGGVGISLHDLYGKPRMSIISPSWSGTDVVQCLGRIHRAGSKSSALQRIVYIAKSYEEEICKKLQEKLAVMSAINDGDMVGPKFDKESFKEIGELEKINNTVANLDDTFEDEILQNKKVSGNINKNDDEADEKLVKKVKTIKRKKFKEVVNCNENDPVDNNAKQTQSYLDKNDEKEPSGRLDFKYKAK